MVPENSAVNENLRNQLKNIGEASLAKFLEEHETREQVLRLSRDVVRNSANSIRAIQRGDFDTARELLSKVAGLVAEIESTVRKSPKVYYAGYVEDAQKEYAEAIATLAFVQGTPLAGFDELGIGPAPYLNGLSETIGELRRFILDSIRKGDFSRCESMLDIMDEVYAVLVTMDFPEAVTGGLRRSTDAARGLLERTRGDVSLAIRQSSLEAKLGEYQRFFNITTPSTRTTLIDAAEDTSS